MSQNDYLRIYVIEKDGTVNSTIDLKKLKTSDYCTHIITTQKGIVNTMCGGYSFLAKEDKPCIVGRSFNSLRRSKKNNNTKYITCETCLLIYLADSSAKLDK